MSKKLLSEPKIVNSTRIVVVGASDCGISFIESLLSIRYIQFTNIYLIAPGGINYELDMNSNLKASSTSYPIEELHRLMLETRVKVINARMAGFDRENKNIFLHDDSQIIYDLLVFSMGL